MSGKRVRTKGGGGEFAASCYFYIRDLLSSVGSSTCREVMLQGNWTELAGKCSALSNKIISHVDNIAHNNWSPSNQCNQPVKGRTMAIWALIMVLYVLFIETGTVNHLSGIQTCDVWRVTVIMVHNVTESKCSVL